MNLHDVGGIAQYLINHAVLFGLQGVHVAVALEILFDVLPVMVGVLANEVEKLCF